jgi:hypothetical protein
MMRRPSFDIQQSSGQDNPVVLEVSAEAFFAGNVFP